ncbi:hypothetical protein DFH06DRAFT_1122953 [Mycena polygramma]|nr:hypothetical protein DFH06DRAFT_1122953 [Mycena polygramma]
MVYGPHKAPHSSAKGYGSLKIRPKEDRKKKKKKKTLSESIISLGSPFHPPASNRLRDPPAVFHSCLTVLYPAGAVLYTPNPLHVARVNGALRCLYPYSPHGSISLIRHRVRRGTYGITPKAGLQHLARPQTTTRKSRRSKEEKNPGPPSSAVAAQLQATCCEDFRNSTPKSVSAMRTCPASAEQIVELNQSGFGEKGHSELVNPRGNLGGGGDSSKAERRGKNSDEMMERNGSCRVKRDSGVDEQQRCGSLRSLCRLRLARKERELGSLWVVLPSTSTKKALISTLVPKSGLEKLEVMKEE